MAVSGAGWAGYRGGWLVKEEEGCYWLLLAVMVVIWLLFGCYADVIGKDFAEIMAPAFAM